MLECPYMSIFPLANSQAHSIPHNSLQQNLTSRWSKAYRRKKQKVSNAEFPHSRKRVPDKKINKSKDFHNLNGMKTSSEKKIRLVLTRFRRKCGDITVERFFFFLRSNRQVVERWNSPTLHHQTFHNFLGF